MPQKRTLFRLCIPITDYFSSVCGHNIYCSRFKAMSKKNAITFSLQKLHFVWFQKPKEYFASKTMHAHALKQTVTKPQELFNKDTIQYNN